MADRLLVEQHVKAGPFGGADHIDGLRMLDQSAQIRDFSFFPGRLDFPELYNMSDQGMRRATEGERGWGAWGDGRHGVNVGRDEPVGGCTTNTSAMANRKGWRKATATAPRRLKQCRPRHRSRSLEGVLDSSYT